MAGFSKRHVNCKLFSANYRIFAIIFLLLGAKEMPHWNWLFHNVSAIL